MSIILEKPTSPKGLTELNNYLADKSYIKLYTPTSADVLVFDEIKENPNATKYPHVARWYKHIAFFPVEVREKWEIVKDVKFAEEEEEEDSDLDLFGSDDEEDEEEKEKMRQEMEKLKAEKLKKMEEKEKKNKSRLVMDIAPYDDETDLMGVIDPYVRSIKMEGLLWGSSALEDIAFGAKKLRITAVIVDALVSTYALEEAICEHEDIQSCDTVSFNKL
ncbi:elongation factor 1-beta [Anaeramoeba flamelloides]|uniref:Elongation factor 1-beta n=1 Tax=Anaeramoeba flamelloides TaxID=1746091 RepID=A0AAV7Y7I6_9EUKA|nr:elongation factor 1-beta [Anaeramoeba flamelloides]